MSETKKYRADLHIHTVLSPCGDLDMSPSAIIERAVALDIDIIGITDHNSTKHCKLAKELGEKSGVFVMQGVEITSREEVHCLAFFETDEQLQRIQSFLDEKLPMVMNNTDKFGYQVVVDADEQIIDQEKRLLISAIDASVDEIGDLVREIGGLFIPAHVNRPMFSLISQLGFIPPDFKADALEISRHIAKDNFIAQNPWLDKFAFIQSSDAHFIKDIGSITSTIETDALSFEAIKTAIVNGNITTGNQSK